MSRKKSLIEKYPPSQPCNCGICIIYCKRPGWWNVKEAARAIKAGYGVRMMLEISPERSFGVLSPAFKGCEMAFAIEASSSHGCTFLNDNRCDLHGTGFQPMECRFCHHDRAGLGLRCHADIEKDWNTSAGRALIVRWSNLTNFWQNFARSMPKISLSRARD